MDININTIPVHAFYINKGALLERKKETIINDNTIETYPRLFTMFSY
jgi:hypothetical protein